MREAWRGLVSENPMLKLSLRAQYQAFLPSKSSSARTVWLLVGVVYLGVTALCATYAEYLISDWLFYPVLALALIVPMNILHGSIAGEREKRSLDTLLVAPLTSGQIVFAKSARALAALGLSLATVVGPYAAIETARLFSQSIVNKRANPMLFSLAHGILVCATAGLLSAGLTILVSSRTRTTAAALVGSLFVVLTWLVGIPMIAGLALAQFQRGRVTEAILASNPFVLLTETMTGSGLSLPEISSRIIVFALAAVGLAVACFLSAARSLRTTPSGRRLPDA
jgi:ABC-type Na+ efflux pump permease subunit